MTTLQKQATAKFNNAHLDAQQIELPEGSEMYLKTIVHLLRGMRNFNELVINTWLTERDVDSLVSNLERNQALIKEILSRFPQYQTHDNH